MTATYAFLANHHRILALAVILAAIITTAVMIAASLHHGVWAHSATYYRG